jgi:hypothetical protein
MRVLIIFAAHSDQPAVQVNGVEISQSQIAQFGLDWDWYLRSSAPCKWSTMSLVPEDLAAAGETITGRGLAPPTFFDMVAPSAPALSRLRELHEAASHLAKTAPAILAKPEVARAMEQALVEAMVLCLAQSRYDDVGNTHRQRARVMRRLEEVLRATSEETLYMPSSPHRSAPPIGHCVTVAWSMWT